MHHHSSQNKNWFQYQQFVGGFLVHLGQRWRTWLPEPCLTVPVTNYTVQMLSNNLFVDRILYHDLYHVLSDWIDRNGHLYSGLDFLGLCLYFCHSNQGYYLPHPGTTLRDRKLTASSKLYDKLAIAFTCCFIAASSGALILANRSWTFLDSSTGSLKWESSK